MQVRENGAKLRWCGRVSCSNGTAGVKTGVAVKPLEEEVVPLTGATIDVRNLRGRIRVYEDSYELCRCWGAT